MCVPLKLGRWEGGRGHQCLFLGLTFPKLGCPGNQARPQMELLHRKCCYLAAVHQEGGLASSLQHPPHLTPSPPPPGPDLPGLPTGFTVKTLPGAVRPHSELRRPEQQLLPGAAETCSISFFGFCFLIFNSVNPQTINRRVFRLIKTPRRRANQVRNGASGIQTEVFPGRWRRFCVCFRLFVDKQQQRVKPSALHPGCCLPSPLKERHADPQQPRRQRSSHSALLRRDIMRRHHRERLTEEKKAAADCSATAAAA